MPTDHARIIINKKTGKVTFEILDGDGAGCLKDANVLADIIGKKTSSRKTRDYHHRKKQTNKMKQRR